MKVITIENIVNVIRARRGYKNFLSKFIEECEIVDAIPIPEGATNGDMIKAIFPDTRVSQTFISFNGDEVYYVPIDKFNGITNEMRVMKSWWNAPYKKGVQE